MGRQGNEQDMKRLSDFAAGDPDQDWDAKLDLQRSFQQGKLAAFFDSGAGLTYADKVQICPYAQGISADFSVTGLRLGPTSL